MPIPANDAGTIVPNPAHGGGIAAALVNVGQGLMLGRNGDGGSTTQGSLVGIPDLTGLDLQGQARVSMYLSPACQPDRSAALPARLFVPSPGGRKPYPRWRGESAAYT